MTFGTEPFRQLIGLAHSPIVAIGLDGVLIEANHLAEEFMGFNRAELVGCNLVTKLAEEGSQGLLQSIVNRALDGEETANFAFKLKHMSGRAETAILTFSPWRNIEGQVVGVLGVGQDITEATLARAEAERTAMELRQFVETANAPIIGIDENGLVNEWNQMAVQITGFTKREVVGRELVADFITEEYKASVWEVLAKALTGEETANFEFPLYTKDEKRVEVLLNASSRRNIEGQIVGVLGVGQDITEATLARAEAERTAMELRQFVETANAPIIGIDENGLVNEWNQMAVQITGFTKREVVGRELVADFITEEYKASVWEVLAKALTGEETANFEFPLYTKDEKRVEVLLNASSRRNIEGQIVGVLGVGQDITEATLARAEAERTAMELRQFVETANAPIIGIDENGLVNEWNQMAVQITGFTKREVVGRELVADFITEEYKASVWEVLAKALTGEETANFEFPLYTKDEKRVEVLLNASSRRNIEGQIVGVLGVGQDITEIRAKEAAERRAGRMEVIGQFTGGMAHDFNNLLTIVQGNISLVVEDAEHLDDTAREILDDALSAAKDGSNLTRQLLAFARNQRLESMEVNVNVLILRLSRLITRTISKSMDLVVNLHPNNPTAHVDLSQLESAILNLCLNGRDAMNSEGTLVLSTDIKHFSAPNALPHDGIHPGNYIEISVKDTGAGMSKEMMALAFEPFYTTKKEGLGSGLGLSMVQSFAIQSKGSVSIVSEEGTGTEVTLLLPMLGQLNPASVVSDDPPPSPAIARRGTVLVVEDEPRVRKFAARCLSEAGYDVLEADCGSRALEILEQQYDIDLVFSDIAMPGGMTGRELAQVIGDKYPYIVVKLTTGFEPNSEPGNQRSSILRKPYTRTDLMHYLEP